MFLSKDSTVSLIINIQLSCKVYCGFCQNPYWGLSWFVTDVCLHWYSQEPAGLWSLQADGSAGDHGPLQCSQQLPLPARSLSPLKPVVCFSAARGQGLGWWIRPPCYLKERFRWLMFRCKGHWGWNENPGNNMEFRQVYFSVCVTGVLNFFNKLGKEKKP